MTFNAKRLVYAALAAASLSVFSVNAVLSKWHALEQNVAGSAVYFHAYGGDPQVNTYIRWLAKQVKHRFDIKLVHVKTKDTADTVSRVIAEKSAGNFTQGQVDLVWINGANFAAMKKHDLLLPNWAFDLPNFRNTNPTMNPQVTHDFGIATEGMESPWGQAALTFYYDSKNVDTPPATAHQLLTWLAENPHRFTYPDPKDFTGIGFLKYALISEVKRQDKRKLGWLYQPATKQAQDKLLPILWRYLDSLHPLLWREGRHFNDSAMALRRLLDDSEISIAMTFSAADIAQAVDRYELPITTQSYAMKDGQLANTHFVAIPFNARHRHAAKVVANFMLSPTAQAFKQHPKVWGDKTVLDMRMLTKEQRSLFSELYTHQSVATLNEDTHKLAEPHPSWHEAILQGWQERYGVLP